MSYLARPLANRGVHIRITPRPSSLGESREILRLLGQFGEIEYYKSLKYDGQGMGRSHAGVGLVIFKEEDGASKCFRGSPVRFRMGRVKAGSQDVQQQAEEEVAVEKREEDAFKEPVTRGKWGLPAKAPFGLEQEPERQKRYSSTSTLPKPPERQLRMPFDPPSPPDTRAEQKADEDRIFQIITSPTRRNFRERIEVGQWHGPFKIDSKNVGQEDLQKRVPIRGLSCVEWNGPEKPLRIVKKERREFGQRERLGVLWERGQVGPDALG